MTKGKILGRVRHEVIGRAVFQALNLAIVAGTITVVAWTIWLGLFGTHEERLGAWLGPIPPAFIGVMSGVIPELIRSRRKSMAERDAAEPKADPEPGDDLCPPAPPIVVQWRWGF